MQNPTYKKAFYLSFTCLCLLGLASYVGAWTAPASAPTGGNSKPPINVSEVNQVKDGSLGLGSLGVTGKSLFSKPVRITSGNPGVGKVLMSDGDGNARWETYEQAVKITKQYKCPAGSATVTKGGRTYCEYTRITGGYGTCDTFGSSYDPMISCIDIGHGRNHGINPYWYGCQAWEGEKNYGGQLAQFTCEKLMYIPKTFSDCTDPKAKIGGIVDPSLSSEPIVTCNIETPYTYKACTTGSMVGGTCQSPVIGYSRFGYVQMRVVGYPIDVAATSTTCMSGWTKYGNNCI